MAAIEFMNGNGDSSHLLLKEVASCRDCSLYANQPPLLGQIAPAKIMWVGLSAVQAASADTTFPLHSSTKTGKVLDEIETRAEGYSFYRTNLVKCLPLDKGKIRYPSAAEAKACLPHFLNELKVLSPRLVILLGKQVGQFIAKAMNLPGLGLSPSYHYTPQAAQGVLFLGIHHPSYILTYKYKDRERYYAAVAGLIQESGRIQEKNHVLF